MPLIIAAVVLTAAELYTGVKLHETGLLGCICALQVVCVFLLMLMRFFERIA